MRIDEIAIGKNPPYDVNVSFFDERKQGFEPAQMMVTSQRRVKGSNQVGRRGTIPMGVNV